MNELYAASGISTEVDKASQKEHVKSLIRSAIGGYGRVPRGYEHMPVAASGFEVFALREEGVSASDILAGVQLAAESYYGSTGRDLSEPLTDMVNRVLGITPPEVQYVET